MLTLLLIIAFSKFEIISGVEENDHKFINSLPENAKKEFLQKVEKRIQNEVPEVKSPERNDTNVDLYEKRLEDQGKSIQTILRSEINNLKSSVRRNTNDTVRQAYIDLTLRTQDEHANKNISFENIPVEVLYDNQNVSYDKSNPSNKTVSKPDVITLENTSHVLRTIDTSNTSADRKRSGRRSNDFEVENVTLPNPDTNARTDAVNATTDININTKSQDVETTSDAVDISVSSESPIIQDVPSNTTRQENGTHANDENSTTAPGNIYMITVVQHDKKLDYISSTQSNTENISTIDDPKVKDKYSDLTIESINAKSDNLVGSTAQYEKTPQIGDNFSNTTQDSDNIQTDNVDISTSQYNLDNITILDSALATTDSTVNTETLNTTHVTADNVVSSTNTFTTMTNKVDSSTTESTKVDILNKMKIDLADGKQIHNISVEVDNEHYSTTQNIQNTISHNLPDSTESGAADGAIHKDHYETTQDNIEIIFSQSRSAKLDDELYGPSLNNDGIRKNLHSTSKYNVKKQKYNIIADNNNTKTYAIPHKMLGVVDNQDHFITVGSKKIVDMDSEPHNGHDKLIAFNLNTMDSQKVTKNLSSIKANKRITPQKKYVWLDVTESLYKTNHNVSGNAPIHKKHKSNKELHEPTLPHTFPKDTVQTSRDTAYTDVGLHGENNGTSDNDEESQTKYVPVYNYDPENAYFRPNTERPSVDNIVERIGSNDPTIIKKKETHSKTTELDMYENGNKKSLRIKDIKERVISASNNIIKSKSDLYDIISDDDSVESSDDDVAYEKPLKHSLKKIRKKLYKHQINNKPKDNGSHAINQSVVENTYKKEVRKKYDAISDKHKENNISELFSKFGTLLQEIVDDNNENSPETKKDSDEGVPSDRELYRDIALSLEHHNRAIRNKGIQKIIDTLEAIQNNLSKKKHKENHIKIHQSRFQVKDRDGKGERAEKPFISFFGNVDKPRVTTYFEHEDVTEKSKTIKIDDDYLELHVNVLKNLVDANDEGLQSYDWLGTTVLIQAGLAKIEDVTERKINNKKLHPLDKELLEFCMKLHETAIRLVAEKENDQSAPPERKRLSFSIPKYKKRNFNALNRLYGEMKKTKMISLIRSRYTVEDLKEFLVNIRTFMHELHKAIKHISSVTTYKKQRWFKNIKQLYLNSAGDKEYLELLLHLVSARLVGLIDERVKKVRYDEDLTKREREVDRIEVEFVMVLRICNELVRLNN